MASIGFNALISEVGGRDTAMPIGVNLSLKRKQYLDANPSLTLPLSRGGNISPLSKQGVFKVRGNL